MSESLGLSIGVANLVAARAGRAPITRSSVVTLFEQRPTEVGLPEENPNLTEPGLVLRGFVERVGDRAPLVAADGTKYLGAALTVEAIEAMARAVGYGSPITIAVPAYWSDAQFAALREEFFAQSDLARGGVAPMLVSDATAALAALRGTPGFGADGVIALCDFGAGGTTVTLMDAKAGFAPVGPATRNTDFSGDAIDQLVLDHLLASDVSTAMLGGAARMGSQARLLGACRRAKEQLSTAAVGTIAGASGDGAQLSRTDFEQLLSAPLDRFLASVEESLRRNGIANAGLSAVAITGGGANIPLLKARLSQRFGVPVHSTAQPALSAALGAAVLGPHYASGVAPTAAAAAVETPTEMVGTAGLDMTQAAWAAQATDVDDALAWSQDADNDEPVPYTGRDATGEYANEAREFDDATGSRYATAPGRLPWYKRTALVLSVAGAGAAVLVALILAINLLLTKSTPVSPTSPTTTAPPQTVTITGPNDSTTVTVIPAPPPPSSEAPATTTTPAPEPSTTTTTAPPPSTTTTTTAPPTTTSQATTTAAPTTTRTRPLPPIFQPPFGR
ncbi:MULTISPECIES: Hsp70 family protein [Mycobacterium]|uniref:Molecular chaperone n=1 Tax=Mycobacterium colombiense TaxID=339268 RepID=A0A329LFY4_9MYCO|nr:MULTISPECIES: Hsp70 family protein [Mycobacterium]MDM4138536.1 Hsp70 family protein [Mycobacterium sp. FLAC0960]RAV06711.1 molecular chaperone [Mycobacterium colombiense]